MSLWQDQGKVSALNNSEQRGNNLLSNHPESCNPSVKDGLPTLYARMERGKQCRVYPQQQSTEFLTLLISIICELVLYL